MTGGSENPQRTSTVSAERPVRCAPHGCSQAQSHGDDPKRRSLSKSRLRTVRFSAAVTSVCFWGLLIPRNRGCHGLVPTEAKTDLSSVPASLESCFLDKFSINGHELLSVCIPTGTIGILKRDSNALKQRGHTCSVQAFQLRHGMRSLGIGQF